METNGLGKPNHCKYEYFDITIKYLTIVDEKGQRKDGGIWFHKRGRDSQIRELTK